MALNPLSDSFIDRVTEGSQNLLHSTWFAVAGVVYGWTDRREPAVDEAWWQKQAPRSYMQEPRVPDIGEVVAPSERLILSQWLQPDLRRANDMFAELASRSSCRGHAFLIARSGEDQTRQ